MDDDEEADEVVRVDVFFDRKTVEMGMLGDNVEKLNNPTLVEYVRKKGLFWRIWDRNTYDQ